MKNSFKFLTVAAFASVALIGCSSSPDDKGSTTTGDKPDVYKYVVTATPFGSNNAWKASEVTSVLKVQKKSAGDFVNAEGQNPTDVTTTFACEKGDVVAADYVIANGKVALKNTKATNENNCTVTVTGQLDGKAVIGTSEAIVYTGEGIDYPAQVAGNVVLSPKIPANGFNFEKDLADVSPTANKSTFKYESAQAAGGLKVETSPAKIYNDGATVSYADITSVTSDATGLNITKSGTDEFIFDYTAAEATPAVDAQTHAKKVSFNKGSSEEFASYNVVITTTGTAPESQAIDVKNDIKPVLKAAVDSEALNVARLVIKGNSNAAKLKAITTVACAEQEATDDIYAKAPAARDVEPVCDTDVFTHIEGSGEDAIIYIAATNTAKNKAFKLSFTDGAKEIATATYKFTDTVVDTVAKKPFKITYNNTDLVWDATDTEAVALEFQAEVADKVLTISTVDGYAKFTKGTKQALTVAEGYTGALKTVALTATGDLAATSGYDANNTACSNSSLLDGDKKSVPSCTHGITLAATAVGNDGSHHIVITDNSEVPLTQKIRLYSVLSADAGEATSITKVLTGDLYDIQTFAKGTGEKIASVVCADVTKDESDAGDQYTKAECEAGLAYNIGAVTTIGFKKADATQANKIKLSYLSAAGNELFSSNKAIAESTPTELVTLQTIASNPKSSFKGTYSPLSGTELKFSNANAAAEQIGVFVSVDATVKGYSANVADPKKLDIKDFTGAVLKTITLAGAGYKQTPDGNNQWLYAAGGKDGKTSCGDASGLKIGVLTASKAECDFLIESSATAGEETVGTIALAITNAQGNLTHKTINLTVAGTAGKKD